MPAAKFRGLSEAQEGRDLARWLDARGVLFCHVPNGGLRNWREAASLKAQGTKAGVPDYLVFSEPTRARGEFEARGVAVELKRADRGQLSPAQRAFITALREAGWVVVVAHGATDAQRQLEALGY